MACLYIACYGPRPNKGRRSQVRAMDLMTQLHSRLDIRVLLQGLVVAEQHASQNHPLFVGWQLAQSAVRYETSDLLI